MKSIAVVSYNYQQYSETFISHLVKNLPFKVHYLYGGELPAFYGDYRPFLPEMGWGKWCVETKALVGKKIQEQHKEAVEQYLLKNNIQAVHANYSFTALPLMDICERNKIPLIVHFRGWTAYRQTILDKYGAQYPKLFSIAAAVICVSADMKQQLIRLGCPENKITIIASGADTAYFHYQNHSANPPVFLSVGRFCDTKNPHLTILAFSKVLQEIPDAKLVMAGGDETLLSACFTLCKALKIELAVSFKGVLTHEQVAEEMKSACL
ncbi:MAG: glycosyltransferase [Bacteroidetes bacterium]|nr:glycosyltransferase [Bacteroidota bacterium]